MEETSCTEQGEKHEFKYIGRAKYQCEWCGYVYEDEGMADYLYEQEKDRRVI